MKEQSDIVERKVNIEIELVQNYCLGVKLIILIALSGYTLWGLSMYYDYFIPEELTKKVELLRDISVIRKTLTYLDLFAFRIVTSQMDLSYSTKIANEAILFYQYTDKVFEQLGNTVFSEVYSVTELLQQYFTKPSQYPINYLRDLYYTRISVVLQNACSKIIELDQTVFYP